MDWEKVNKKKLMQDRGTIDVKSMTTYVPGQDRRVKRLQKKWDILLEEEELMTKLCRKPVKVRTYVPAKSLLVWAKD